MRRLLIIFLAIFIAGIFWPVSVINAGGINIPDPNLEAVLRETLNKPVGTITDVDLEFIIYCDGHGRGITDITGLEYCDNLLSLNLSDNDISDISALSLLFQRNSGAKLRELDLSNNQIRDISALADLWQVGIMNLADNQISDLSPLANENRRYNVNLLNLSGNRISDLSGLRSMTNLQSLYISGNEISDISPLVENSGLGIGDIVNLHNNPLSDTAQNTDVPALQQRWVKVFWSLPIPPPREPLVIVPEPEIAVNFECTVMESLVRDTINKPEGAIFPSDLNVVTALNGRGMGISDLSGIEYCVNLSNLYLGGNCLTDIDPLSELDSLVTLELNNNSISDITALTGLDKLRRLNLNSNNISDIGVLKGLKGLEVLRLESNLVTDTSPLLENDSLGAGCCVWLGGNDIAGAADAVAALATRGITVDYWAPALESTEVPGNYPFWHYLCWGLGALAVLGGVLGFIFYLRYKKRDVTESNRL